jgi:phage terminase large subunit
MPSKLQSPKPPKTRKPAAKVEVVKPSATDIILRGGNRAAFGCKEPELINSGPADTGKTFAMCLKAHVTAALCPGAQGAILRKTATSLAGTVLKTFAKVISNQGVRVFGGETPQRYIYPNGSVIWLGGMDHPERVLSSERDFIYGCQVEEFTLNDWELLGTRTSGRGAVVENAQLFGDCNPAGSKHWIKERAAQGRLRLFTTTHKDNPSIYDEAGNLTAEGAKRLAALADRLTGVRRMRLLEGIWATAEGAVYDTFNSAQTGIPSDHVQVRLRSEMKRFFLTMDEGYTNPAVILDVGEDSDGRQHIFREFYERGVIPENHVAAAVLWWNEDKGRKYELCAVDESAAGLIASLQARGINAVGGKGSVEDGIALVKNRLKVQGDGRPRLTVDPGCVNVINEFESYIYKPKPGSDAGTDVPRKEDDHAMDAIRYLQDALATPTGAIGPGDVAGMKSGGGTAVPPRLTVPRQWPGRPGWPGR